MAWTKTKISIIAAALVAASAGSVWTVQTVMDSRSPSSIPGLIGWWKLDDADTDTIQDTSPLLPKIHNATPNPGTPMNNPGTAPGKKGQALALEGKTQQYVSLGKILQGSYQEFSVSCWVKHPRSNWQIVVERNRPDDTDGISLMMDNMGQSIDFGHYPDFVKSKAKVQDNQWHHVVGTMAPSGDQFTYKIYVDGKLDNASNLLRGLTATKEAWSIGARHDGSFPYVGLIDDVRLYNHALTSSEVRRLYKN